jgi:hypothetical protein
MAHREAIFGHCLAADRWLGCRLTDFSDGFWKVSSPKFATTCNALATVKITLLRDALVLAAGVGYQTLRSRGRA